MIFYCEKLDELSVFMAWMDASAGMALMTEDWIFVGYL